MEQYNPTLAIGAIESTKEVEAAMRKLQVRPVPAIGVQLLAEPAKGLPHFPPSMKNVTVEQALDSIAKTFKDVVVYGACTRLFWVGLVGVDGFGAQTQHRRAVRGAALNAQIRRANIPAIAPTAPPAESSQ